MTATILKEHRPSSPLLDDAINLIVLEDQRLHRQAIDDLIKESHLGWSVFFAQDKDEVEKLANEHNAAYYVLDINLGPEKSQEGMTTAEFIKNDKQKNTFVAMFSAIPNLAEFKKMASRIGVDYFEEKSGNIQWNVCRIALEMLRYQKHLITGILEGDRTSICKLEPLKVESLTNQLENINKKLVEIGKLEISYSDSTASHSLASATIVTPQTIKEDKNIQAYEKLMTNASAEWIKKYDGKYFAFADGQWLKNLVSDDISELLSRLRDSEYSQELVFYTKVPKDDIVYELPMSLLF